MRLGCAPRTLLDLVDARLQVVRVKSHVRGRFAKKRRRLLESGKRRHPKDSKQCWQHVHTQEPLKRTEGGRVVHTVHVVTHVVVRPALHKPRIDPPQLLQHDVALVKHQLGACRGEATVGPQVVANHLDCRTGEHKHPDIGASCFCCTCNVTEVWISTRRTRRLPDKQRFAVAWVRAHAHVGECRRRMCRPGLARFEECIDHLEPCEILAKRLLSCRAGTVSPKHVCSRRAYAGGVREGAHHLKAQRMCRTAFERPRHETPIVITSPQVVPSVLQAHCHHESALRREDGFLDKHMLAHAPAPAHAVRNPSNPLSWRTGGPRETPWH
eukprot:2126893-Prymnesium_polylepis.2